MKISKERAEYLSNMVNDHISNVFKELTILESVMNREEYETLIQSNNKELKEIVDLGCLPPDFLAFLENLPEMF